ncbi:MAG: hypothetical protein ACI9Q3_001024, partial [Maribacter sp.]
PFFKPTYFYFSNNLRNIKRLNIYGINGRYAPVKYFEEFKDTKSRFLRVSGRFIYWNLSRALLK